MNEKQPNSDRLETDEPDPVLNEDPDELTSELVAYLDGELDRDQNEAVGAKISLDSTVRSEADALKKTWDLLDYLPRPEPSPNFTERTISRIEPLNKSGTASGPAVAGSGPASSRPSAAIVPAPSRRSPGRKLAWAAGWLLAIAFAGVAGWFIRETAIARFERIDQQEKDAKILSERRLLDNLRHYRHIDNLQFLQELDDPDLFGDEQNAPMNGGSR